MVEEIKRLFTLKLSDKWNPSEEGEHQVKTEIYKKYKGELYGILCMVTGGEAKGIVRGIIDLGSGQDGFKAW